jgi:hypothetical protein
VNLHLKPRSHETDKETLHFLKIQNQNLLGINLTLTRIKIELDNYSIKIVTLHALCTVYATNTPGDRHLLNLIVRISENKNTGNYKLFVTMDDVTRAHR